VSEPAYSVEPNRSLISASTGISSHPALISGRVLSKVVEPAAAPSKERWSGTIVNSGKIYLLFLMLGGQEGGVEVILSRGDMWI
jgi:hypothetical protein